MILRRRKPTTPLADNRTFVVVDRLERVADTMERLATEMELRLRVRADREGDNGTGS